MDQEGSEDGSQQNEDEEDARASKRSRMVLDSDEAAFASSIRSIRPTPGATSQYDQDLDNQKEDGDAPGQGDDQQSDQDDVDEEMPDPSDNGEDDQEQFGFQDNGVCLQKILVTILELTAHI
jgi:hypothetical protein